MDLVLKGLVTGFILSVMIGPVFFVLLETSIRKGIKAALAFDFGVLISDILYILIAYVFYKEVEDLSRGADNSVLKLIGGILFLAYGVYNFFSKVKEVKLSNEKTSEVNAKDYILLGLKGFVLNIANPLVIFYWFGVLSFGVQGVEVSETGSMFLYLLVILVTFFSIDVLKILGAKKLRPLVTERLLIGLNRLIGIVFVVFGIILLLQGLKGFR